MLHIVSLSLLKDKNDESLEQYKKNLLGTIDEEGLKEDEGYIFHYLAA